MTDRSGHATEKRAAMQRALLRLVVSVLVLDAVAIGSYYALGVRHWPGKRQMIFTLVWLVVTVGVVLPGLRGMRKARFGR